MAWTTTTALVTLAVLAAASTATTVAAAQSSASAQESAAKFNAAVERNNALAATQQAQYDADRLRRRNLLLRGAQEAAIGKSGVDMSGSALDVVADSSMQGELDRLAALYTGKVRANRDYAAAALENMRADSAVSTGMYNSVGSILGGASQVAGAYGSYRLRA